MNPSEQEDRLAFFADACGKAVARCISVGFNQPCIKALQTQKAKSAMVASSPEITILRRGFHHEDGSSCLIVVAKSTRVSLVLAAE